MTRLSDTPDELSALVSRTSGDLGIPEAFVAKDFWVVEVLRSVAAPYEDVTVVFKGGTSLSKAYQIIDRMSEDVDILLAFPDKATKGARERALRSLTERVATDLGITPTPVSSTTNVKQNSRFVYPVAARSGPLSEGVLLEMGVRGGPFPREDRDLRSYVADLILRDRLAEPDEFVELSAVRIAVLSPVRTLIEKICAVHDAASRLPEDRAAKRLAKYARHYYDIERLLHDPSVVELMTPQGLEEIVVDVNKYSALSGYEWTPRPDGGYARSAAFSGSTETRAVLEPAYGRAMEYIIAGRSRPTFDDCLQAVRRAAALL
jgi:hypothetical protein